MPQDQKYFFKYCQKLVVFSKNDSEILLCKRKGEIEYDGTYSFIGGKMETSDKTLIDSMQREKNEEVGRNFRIALYPTFAFIVYSKNKDGSSMILPHFYSQYIFGKIELSDEYSEYRWIKINELNKFEPKIANIPPITHKLLQLKKILPADEKIII